MGPLISAEHRAKVEKYVETGINEGATLAVGGKRPEDPELQRDFSTCQRSSQTAPQT